MEELEKTNQTLINQMVGKLFEEIEVTGRTPISFNKESKIYKYYRKLGQWLSADKPIGDDNFNPLLPLYVYGGVGVGKSSIFKSNSNDNITGGGWLVYVSLDSLKKTDDFDLILNLYHLQLQADQPVRITPSKLIPIGNDGYQIVTLVIDEFGFENDNFNDYGQLTNKMEYVTKKLHDYYNTKFFDLYNKRKIIPKIIIISSMSPLKFCKIFDNIEKRIVSRFSQLFPKNNSLEVGNDIDYRLV